MDTTSTASLIKGGEWLIKESNPFETFTPEDYNGLRDFFAFIVKKQNEQIVMKKK